MHNKSELCIGDWPTRSGDLLVVTVRVISMSIARVLCNIRLTNAY